MRRRDPASLALAALLSAACHRGPPAVARVEAPSANATVDAGHADACLDALRAALSDQLAHAEALVAPPGGWTLATLDDAWTAHPNGYGFAGRCLTLPRPADAIPALRARLSHRNQLTRLEAAAVLALLGDRSGVPQLLAAETITQSGEEFFYARGALRLLGETIPAELAARRCQLPRFERALDCR